MSCSYILDLILFALPTLMFTWLAYNTSIMIQNKETPSRYISNILIGIYLLAHMYYYCNCIQFNYICGIEKSTFKPQYQLMLMIPAFIGVYAVKNNIKTDKVLSRSAILEAVDEFPNGLCFFSSDGTPILINRKMYALIKEFSAEPLVDADIIWSELLKKADKKNEFFPLNIENKNEIYYRFKNNSLWRFKKNYIKDEKKQKNYIQIEAFDVSRLGDMAVQIERTNKELKSQNERIRLNTKEMEVFYTRGKRCDSKYLLHKKLGNSILQTTLFIQDFKTDRNLMNSERMQTLQTCWNTSASYLNTGEENSDMQNLEEELKSTAETLGFILNLPDYKPPFMYSDLYYHTLYDCMGNALRHTDATELYVDIEEYQNFIRIKISDNATAKVAFEGEGTGLKALKQKLKQKGVILTIQIHDRFQLIIDFPYRKTIT